MREGGARAWGAAPMRLPTIYRGGGAGFLPSKSIGALAEVGERNPIISLPHRLLSPFLGILILSLRDMILFLLRGDLGRASPSSVRGRGVTGGEGGARGLGAQPSLPLFI